MQLSAALMLLFLGLASAANTTGKSTHVISKNEKTKSSVRRIRVRTREGNEREAVVTYLFLFNPPPQVLLLLLVQSLRPLT